MCCCIELHLVVIRHLHVLTTSMLSRFVLENSGVAEPQNIRDQFNDGIAAGALSPTHDKAYFDLSSMAQFVSSKPYNEPLRLIVSLHEPSHLKQSSGSKRDVEEIKRPQIQELSLSTPFQVCTSSNMNIQSRVA